MGSLTLLPDKLLMYWLNEMLSGLKKRVKYAPEGQIESFGCSNQNSQNNYYCGYYAKNTVKTRLFSVRGWLNFM
jgi:hypothetical protein